jgi:hypothetical protein
VNRPSAAIDVSKASFLSRVLVSMTCSQITYRAVTSEAVPEVEREVLNYRKIENFRLCQSAAEVVQGNMASELGVCYRRGTT